MMKTSLMLAVVMDMVQVAPGEMKHPEVVSMARGSILNDDDTEKDRVLLLVPTVAAFVSADQLNPRCPANTVPFP